MITKFSINGLKSQQKITKAHENTQKHRKHTHAHTHTPTQKHTNTHEKQKHATKFVAIRCVNDPFETADATKLQQNLLQFRCVNDPMILFTRIMTKMSYS